MAGRLAMALGSTLMDYPYHTKHAQPDALFSGQPLSHFTLSCDGGMRIGVKEATFGPGRI